MRTRSAVGVLPTKDNAVNTLRELASTVVAAHDRRLQNEHGMVAYEYAIEQLRSALALGLSGEAASDDMPLELQAMRHVSAVLGSLESSAARARALLVVALAMAPDAFSERQYMELVRRAKGA